MVARQRTNRRKEGADAGGGSFPFECRLPFFKESTDSLFKIICPNQFLPVTDLDGIFLLP
jgi:hypothetical protein